jgi:hypothetical protein
MTTAIVLLTLFSIILVVLLLTSSKPTDHWKEVVYTQYKDNILFLQHKDHSFTEYKLDSANVWRKMPGMKRVDNNKATELNNIVSSLNASKRKGRGGSKTY